MAKIDEVKETLNTLRTFISLGIGVIVALAGVISTLYDMNDFGVKFYIAIVSVNALIVLIFLLLRFLFRKTKELREL